ncbi:hypothetical protein QMG83_10760 [Salinibacterium sp. G-O1]|nr:hypothetical protein [Salinibacterium sp. G-O1]MDJ0335704.1 hypothetical protein [Salinibacterium sp. G-O1]
MTRMRHSLVFAGSRRGEAALPTVSRWVTVTPAPNADRRDA